MENDELKEKLKQAQNYLAQQRITFTTDPTGENLGMLTVALSTMLEELLGAVMETI